MADPLTSFLNHLGLLQRLQEERQSAQQGTLFGHDTGDIPVLGGILRPSVMALQGIGMGLEGLGAAGQTIGGAAALPAVAAQAQFGGADNPLTDYSRTLLDQGAGNYLSHPRQNLEALRHSPDRATSYLAGLLEMVSDPTNVALAPVGGAIEAERAAQAANRARAGFGVSDEFITQTGENIARANERLPFYEGLLNQEGARNAAHQQGKQDIADFAAQLEAAGKKREAAQFDMQEFKDYYKEARGGVAELLKSQRAAGAFEKVPRARIDAQTNLPYMPVEAADAAARNDALRKTLTEEALSRFPGGPKQGQTWHEYLAEPKQALYEALNEERAVRALYEKAVKEAPGPIKYDIHGTPLGKDKGLLRIPDVNTSMNAQEAADYAGLPVDNAGAELTGALNPAGEPDSPEAIRQAVDDVGKAAQITPENIVPEETRGFGTRMSDLIGYALREGLKEQKTAMGREGVKVNFGELASIWKGQATQTLRNIFMDEAFSRILSLDAGIRQKTITANKDYTIRRLTEAEGGDAGQENPLMLLGRVSDILSQVGLGKKLDPKAQKAILDSIGINPFEAETKNAQELSAMQHLVGGSIVGLANPLRPGVNPLAFPLAYLAPMRQRMFHIINNVTHMAAKGAAFEEGFLPFLENGARTLFALAEQEGRDVSLLKGWGMTDNLGEAADGMLLHEGAFSPELVRQVLGPRYAEEWQRTIDGALDAGYKRATEVFGNYSQRGKLEQNINKFVPFMSWTWRAYPRVAKMVLAHPAVAAGVLQLYEAEIGQAKEQHLPGYLSTTIGIGRDTPLIGTLARVFSPDQEAEARFNPLSFISPLPTEGLSALAGGTQEDTGAKTPYQQLKEAAGVVGLGANPLIQAGAYVTGQDYQSPSPLSRYANIDQMWDDLGISNLEAPSLAHGTLRAARKAITGQQDTYDPVQSKANELVYEDTGHPLSDIRNRMIAAQMGVGDSTYPDRAERILDVQGSGRTIFNAVSPVSVSVRTKTTADRQAEGKPPFDFALIKEVEADSPAMADTLRALNDEWYRTHPAAAVNRKPNVSQANLAVARGAAKRKALQEALGVPGR